MKPDDEIDMLVSGIQAVGDLLAPDGDINGTARDRLATLIAYLSERLQKKINQARSLKI